MNPILLRRTGARPLRFSGATLSRTVFRLAGNGTVTLGLHANEAGGLICEYGCRPPDEYTNAAGLWPHHAAEPADSTAAAAAIFESFSPTPGMSSCASNLVRLAMQVCLRAAVREAVGEFLFTLASAS